ncbi:MAG: serine/threonine protein kinase [Gammaproteobacteria bacterium]|nr:serine/threonine protein kinase [Gammaproteobacteria bacterium]
MSDTEDLATQWRSISHLLDEALLLSASERPRWLAELPAAHAHLRDTLEHFLQMHARLEGDSFLESPAVVSADSATPAMLSPGDSVGPYRVIEELGTGGMGSVWLAERADGKPRRRVALKLPRMVWASDLSARMEQERDILASLEHPNIARLYDAGLDEQARPYLAIEYVEGVRITHYCQEQKLDTRGRVELFIQVLAAIQYAHTRLVLHRDLKPGNILVNREGEVRLLDFGIAKLVQETPPDLEADAITMTRALTPRYASPEQLRGERLTLVSDVYSLGVILHELLTGLSPYPATAKGRAEVELAVMEGVSTPPSRRVSSALDTGEVRLSGVRLARELRGELDAIVLKSLSLDIPTRYASVEALASDLDHWLNGRPVQASAPSVFTIVRKFVLRNRLAVFSATIATLAILAMSGVAVHQAKKATAESQRAAATRDFLIDMFESANPELHDGREATVRELVHAAAKNLELAGAGDDALATEVYAAISNVWLRLGDDESAIAALRKRADLLSENNVSDRKVTARFDEARLAAHSLMVSRLRESLASATAHDAASNESVSTQADRYWLLGWLSLENDEIQNAQGHFRTSNLLARKLGDDMRIIRSYYGLASVSARFANTHDVRKIIDEGLLQVERSRLSKLEKIKRKFELISCLALIGDYEYGWPLMAAVFYEAKENSKNWVPSQIEIYSYKIMWATRVGDLASADQVIDSIIFENIPNSLRKSDLMLVAALSRMRSGAIGNAITLVNSALEIYQQRDPDQSYKALASLSEIAVLMKNFEHLGGLLQNRAWTSSIEKRHFLDRSLLLEWFKGVKKFSEKDFRTATAHFCNALEFAKKRGPATHPRVALIKLAIWKSTIYERGNTASFFDKKELVLIGKEIRSSSSSDHKVIKLLESLEKGIVGSQAREKRRSYPDWEISLL